MPKRGVYRRRHRKDGNSDMLVEFLRAGGIAVELIGEPTDAVCAFGLITDLVEFKTLTGKLNADQVAFIKRWPAPVPVLRTLQDAREYLSGLKRRASILALSSEPTEAFCGAPRGQGRG